jgi:hypothetical protein
VEGVRAPGSWQVLERTLAREELDRRIGYAWPGYPAFHGPMAHDRLRAGRAMPILGALRHIIVTAVGS